MPFRKHGWMRPFQRRTSTPKRRCCISCAFRHGGRVERAKKIVKLRRLGLSLTFPNPSPTTSCGMLRRRSSHAIPVFSVLPLPGYG